MADKPKVTDYDIKEALANKHYQEFFMTEVKNGPTYNPQAQGLLIFDAMAIYKSWSRPRIVIYEVKVSRGDFLQDGKWHLYKQYCHEFNFVVPTGLIKKDELPDDVGLMYYSPETKTIRTVKKPLWRNIEINASMLMYIIMNKIDSDRIPFFSNRAEYFKTYIENRQYRKTIGRELGTKMAREIERLNKEISNISNGSQKVKADNYDRIVKLCRELGIIGAYTYDNVETIENALKTQKQTVDLEPIQISLSNALNKVNRAMGIEKPLVAEGED